MISTLQARENLILTKTNHVYINGPITEESVKTFSNQLMILDSLLIPGKPIYLVMDTPGGSVLAGASLISLIHSLDRPVHSISRFAASMGFQIVQATQKRYIIESGILMSHKATTGVQGQINGTLDSQLAFFKSIIKSFDTVAAKRMKISLSKYLQLIENELWMYGEKNIELNAADEIVNVKCELALLQERTCPL